MKPYFERNGILIYHGDCREILPTLPKVDLVLTDPPYGLGRCSGMGGGGFDSTGRWARHPKTYAGGWDNEAPSRDTFTAIIASAIHSIIWGGNFVTDRIPQSNKWLVWDKEQVMPSFSDAELAFTTLSGDSVKLFKYGVNKHRAEEDREHPTQKPVALMKWCLSFFPKAQSVIDPYMGSGTTLVACKEMNIACTGIEIEEKYCEIAARRLEQEVFQFS